jgi:hypothetical protein
LVQLLQSTTNFVSTDEVGLGIQRDIIEGWLLLKTACECLVGWCFVLAG